MPIAVADASVVLKWVLPEPGSGEALALLNRYENGEVDLIAPRLLLEEAASSLARRCRRGELRPAQATSAFAWICSRSPELRDGPDAVAIGLDLALQYQISFLDSMYLALAIEHRCDLVTADVRLSRSLSPHYPFIRLLA